MTKIVNSDGTYVISDYTTDGISLVTFKNKTYVSGSFSDSIRHCTPNGIVIDINEGTVDNSNKINMFKKYTKSPRTPWELQNIAYDKAKFQSSNKKKNKRLSLTTKLSCVSTLKRASSYSISIKKDNGEIRKEFGKRNLAVRGKASISRKLRSAMAKNSTYYPPKPNPYKAVFTSRIYPELNVLPLIARLRWAELPVYDIFGPAIEGETIIGSAPHLLDASGTYTTDVIPWSSSNPSPAKQLIGKCHVKYWEAKPSGPSSTMPLTAAFGFDPSLSVNGFLEFSLCNLIPPTVFTDLSAEKHNRLVDKLWEKASGSKFNALITLGEGKETLSMLFNLIHQLLDIMVAIKHKDYQEAFRILILNRPGSSSLSSTHNAKLALMNSADIWLTFRFGISPLIQDIQALVDKIKNINDRSGSFRYRVRTSSSEEKKTNVSIGNKHGFKLANVSRKTDYQLVAYLNHDLDFIDSFGLLDFPSLVWELIPYSFIVDWFIQIGDKLQNMNTVSVLRGTFVLTTTTYTTVSGITPGTSRPPNYGGTRASSLYLNDPKYDYMYESWQRHDININVIPPLQGTVRNNLFVDGTGFSAPPGFKFPVGTDFVSNSTNPVYKTGWTRSFTFDCRPDQLYSNSLQFALNSKTIDGSIFYLDKASEPSIYVGTPQSTIAVNQITEKNDRVFESQKKVERLVLTSLTDLGQTLETENKFTEHFALHSTDVIALLLQKINSIK